MVNRYDAIVIGGGHNGLVAGAYLARTGAKTVVLEARRKTGGAASTDSPWPEAPEFKATTYSYVMSLMPDRIVNDLNLKRHGYKLHPIGPYYQAWPDGCSLKIYQDDAKANYINVARFSKRDAENLPKWDAWMHGIAEVLGPMLMTVPPRFGSKRPHDLLQQLRTAWQLRGLNVRGVADVTRLFTMSITDLLNEWFESEQLKAVLMVNGIIGAWAGPDEPGTGYVMLHHSVGDVGDGHLGNWAFVEGGMGGVANSVQCSAQEYGCEIRVNAPVEKILVKNGRAAGVVLRGGEELQASVIITTIHPKITFLKQIDCKELPADFVADLQRWKTRSGVVKINLALAELPDFKANPGTNPQDHHKGSIEMCLSTAYAETAFQEAKNGRAAQRPFCEATIPTVWDTSLAPKGAHIMSMFTQWVPYEWAQAPRRKELEAYADRVIDAYNELAPNLHSAILHRQIIGPYDMEQELGMIGGNIFHGELSAEQLFHMRPAPGYADFRSPIRGLYQGGSATHGGGGVSGIPAYQAVKQIQSDRALKRSRNN